MTSLQHALAYAARGWRVAPIAPGTKWPRISEWQINATTDPAIVTTWWHRFPGDGVSIVTGEISNLVVVDVDPRHDGDETLADLERLHGPLPDTMESITGGGGRHLYFRWPDGVPFPRNDQTAATLGAGLDVRGEGGQVVAPPTIHPDTAIAYAWEVAHDPFDGVTPVLPPAWLIDMLTATPPPRVARSTTGRALGDRPGDIFERSTTWPELLGAAGWTLHSVAPDGHELWCRPGKEIRQGPSASLYYRGSDVLKVFTTSAAPLEATRTYDRWGFHVVTTQGSMSNEAIAAASSLYRKALNSMPAAPSGPISPEAPKLVQPADRPMIVHNGRQLDDVTAVAIRALAASNDPPQLFVRAGTLARLRRDEEERPIVETLRTEHIRLALSDSALWFRANKDGERTATSPPLDVAATVLARGDWPLPALAGVVELPVLRPDGTFAVEHGYDAATRLYHWHPGKPYPPIPAQPTSDELAAAVALVDEALCDFPWDTTADRANAWGLLLTPLIRPLATQVPMALVDAPEPGTGKGLLTEVLALITIGRSAAVMAWPTTEEEVEKKATAALMAGSTMIIWDNVEGLIRSGTLAAVLTADSWQGRILGRSEMVMVPNRATWLATGNNINVGGDLARRCYRIRLDARQAQPWKRSGFRHPNLKQWVADNRHELLHALCVIVSAWNAAGRPAGAALPAMGGYSGWVQTISGILDHAGVTGFLANLDDFHADADQEARQWEAFLTSWDEWYGEQPVTTATLVAHVRDIMTGGAMRDALPDDLAGDLESSRFAVRLGIALRRRAGRHHGDSGIHVVEMPRDRRQIAIWCVTTRSVQLFDDEPRGSEATPANDNSPTRHDAKSAGVAGVPPLEPSSDLSDYLITGNPGSQLKPEPPQPPRSNASPLVDELEGAGVAFNPRGSFDEQPDSRPSDNLDEF